MKGKRREPQPKAKEILGKPEAQAAPEILLDARTLLTPQEREQVDGEIEKAKQGGEWYEYLELIAGMMMIDQDPSYRTRIDAQAWDAILATLDEHRMLGTPRKYEHMADMIMDIDPSKRPMLNLEKMKTFIKGEYGRRAIYGDFGKARWNAHLRRYYPDEYVPPTADQWKGYEDRLKVMLMVGRQQEDFQWCSTALTMRIIAGEGQTLPIDEEVVEISIKALEHYRDPEEFSLASLITMIRELHMLTATNFNITEKGAIEAHNGREDTMEPPPPLPARPAV